MHIDQPEIPENPKTHKIWSSAKGAAASLYLSLTAKATKQPLFIITNNAQQATQLYYQLRFFICDDSFPIFSFPDLETLPYDHFSPHEDIISERLRTLYQLPKLTHGIVIASVNSIMHRLCPKSFLISHTLMLQTGETIQIDNFKRNLISAGYNNVSQVMTHGEFAIRGSILDIFPMGSSAPLRLDFFDDEVETMRYFDPDTQRSLEKIDQIELLPAHEFLLTDNSIQNFRANWREAFSGNPMDSDVYEAISQAKSSAGIEYYLPLFHTELNTIFDYLPENSLVTCMQNIHATADNHYQEIKARHDQLAHDIRRPICQPDTVFIPPNDLFSLINQFAVIKIAKDGVSDKAANIQLPALAPPELLIEHKSKTPLSKLENFIIKQPETQILFCAETAGRRETLLELFKPLNIKIAHASNWKNFIDSDSKCSIIVGPLDEGLYLSEPSLCIITENQLFGEQVQQRRLRKNRKIDPDVLFKNLTELTLGAAVVHINHGVGRYRGLKTIETNGIPGEYLTIEYADDGKIYVPVSSLHLISRYSAGEGDSAPIQNLGSKKWERVKQKALQKIRDVAAELLQIYSQRQAAIGYQYKLPEIEYPRFASEFAFEETPDQASAIDDTIKDMCSKRPMDRLICGDVGFGKTEVAMRAAFIAAINGKQVAILVPTTLLAQQHLDNFKDRFADWPLKVEGLFRLRTAKEQAETLIHLKQGKVDIVIGTHKLLGKDINFKDLGLLIIDEEHRFGVKQKDKIMALRAHVDILTLTATPIPRTLNMSMSHIRDMSIIATPPAKRLSVKTFIQQYDPHRLREAVLREILRGGQVYFLHNEVKTIHSKLDELSKLIPEAKIVIAHGQMRERELERVMTDFYHGRFHVLLCTTIIESGIDVPTANTIIINRADHFGLAQLHQLRGRVGRSHHQAFAYLIVPPEKSMTRDAVKRLDAFSQLDELGAGFNLASHDLEIRGAGNLLGEEQSGHIHELGFSLYMELLDEAVTALKEGKEPNLDFEKRKTLEIEIPIAILLPDTYVTDIAERLSLYKRLSNCKNNAEISIFKEELIDRFGKLPQAAQNLITISKQRLIAKQLGIEKIEVTKHFGYIKFQTKPNVDVRFLIQLIQQEPKKYQLQGADKLRFAVDDKAKNDPLILLSRLVDILLMLEGHST